MSKKIYAKISIGWDTSYIMPLAEAHKLQALLAEHATGFRTHHRNVGDRLMFLEDCEVPAVVVEPFPEYDCRGMTKDKIRAWLEAVGDATGDCIMNPQHFLKLTGDSNE